MSAIAAAAGATVAVAIITAVAALPLLSSEGSHHESGSEGDLREHFDFLIA